MPKEWYLMTRPLFNSGFESDEFLAYGIDGFNEVLDSFIGKDVLVYDKAIYKEPLQIRAIIQNVTSDTVNNTYIRQILCNIGFLHCGQYIKVDDAYWLVATLPDNNGVYEKAVLWKSKYLLRFLSPLTGEIVDYPIYNINSTQYGTGESAKTNISVEDANHLIYIPYNEETILLDDNFRFLMDRNRQNPTAYRITQVDPLSYAVGGENNDGLIQWTVIATPFNEETDSKELMVADYFKKRIGDEKTEQGVSGNIVLMDMDGDQRIAIGEEKTVRVIFRSDTGNDTPIVDYIAEIESVDGIGEIRSQKDNEIILYIPSNRSLVGKTFILHVSCANIEQEARLAIQVVNW